MANLAVGLNVLKPPESFQFCTSIRIPPRKTDKVLVVKCKASLLAQYVLLYKNSRTESILSLNDISFEMFGNAIYSQIHMRCSGEICRHLCPQDLKILSQNYFTFRNFTNLFFMNFVT